jgi:hypothetical protein
MKPFHAELSDANVHSFESDLQTRIEKLFGRCPALCGFALQRSDGSDRIKEPGLDSRLAVAEVGIFPALGANQFEEIHDEITLAILDLVYERPEAADLLGGRTFARMLQ